MIRVFNAPIRRALFLGCLFFWLNNPRYIPPVHFHTHLVGNLHRKGCIVHTGDAAMNTAPGDNPIPLFQVLNQLPVFFRFFFAEVE